MEFDKNGILNRAKAAQKTAAVMDEGLRAYMLKVYNYMATGILLTGIVALLSTNYVLGFCSFDGSIIIFNFIGLYWNECNKSFLHYICNIWSDEYLWIHN